jgi:hypothetical protein
MYFSQYRQQKWKHDFIVDSIRYYVTSIISRYCSTEVPAKCTALLICVSISLFMEIYAVENRSSKVPNI